MLSKKVPCQTGPTLSALYALPKVAKWCLLPYSCAATPLPPAARRVWYCAFMQRRQLRKLLGSRSARIKAITSFSCKQVWSAMVPKCVRPPPTPPPPSPTPPAPPPHSHQQPIGPGLAANPNRCDRRAHGGCGPAGPALAGRCCRGSRLGRGRRWWGWARLAASGMVRSAVHWW